MRKSSLTLLAAVFGLAASQASAADLPRKAPPAPPPPPPLTWSGCYIGANVGGAWGRISLEGPFGGTFDRSTNNASFVGGGQIGCDYQFAGGWVIGFRNMFDGTTNSRDRTFNVVGPKWSSLSNWNVRNQDAMVRCPDGSDRLFVATQLAALLSGRRGLGSCPGRLSSDHHCGTPALQPLQRARFPKPKPAGRLAVAGNINSRRSGRCLSKAITTTSARVSERYLPPSAPSVVVLAVLSAPKRLRPLPWSV